MRSVQRPVMLAAVMLVGCASTPGVTRTSTGNPIVTIEAGDAEVSGGVWRVWYVIDTRTQTCWLKLGDSGAAMSCHDLRRVREARKYITWKTAAARPPTVPPDSDEREGGD